MSVASDLLDLLVGELSTRGFGSRNGGIMLLPLDDECSGWIGLNRSRRPDGIAVLPVVGVRFGAVEKLVLEGTGNRSRIPFATLTTPLPPLAGKRGVWQLASDRDNSVEIASLMQAVEGPGLDFIKLHSDPDRLASALQSKWRGWPAAAYQWPTALAQFGRLQEASAAADLVESNSLSDTDVPTQNLRSYLRWLRERFNLTSELH